MKINSTHSIPLGVGFEGWSGHPTEAEVNVCEHSSGTYLRIGGIHNGKKMPITALSMQDAEALCYLLYDLTQPLRDAREKPATDQGDSHG